MGRLFGTDGVRGIVNETLTCELAMTLGRAAACVLPGRARRRPVFVLGADPRRSSEMLCCALAAGLCSAGADVYALGVVPTPAVAYLTGLYGADAGVMVSASHNGAAFNGIKLFSGDGCKLPDALEERIEAIVLDGAATAPLCAGADAGRVLVKESAVRDYVEHLKSTVPTSLEGMTVAVDCANGSASAAAEMLLSGLGARCHMLSDRPDGVNINRGCGSTDMAALRAYVLKNRLEIGVAFDGDADRCMCVDGEGSIIDGDCIMAICALDMLRQGRLESNTVVGTVMSNMGFARFCEEHGLRFVAARVGDRYVLEEMHRGAYSLGGEPSGHIIFRELATTGDGLLTAVQLLSLLRRQNTTLARAARIMTRYPQVMVNVETSDEGRRRFRTDETVRAAVGAGEAELGRNGRVVVRASGTEPLIRVMTEGSDAAQTEQVARRIAAVIRERLA